MDRAAEPADGNRLLMVCQELLMALFCLLYAYPHIPSRIIDDQRSTTWYSIGSKDALRAAIDNLLRNSEVLRVSLAPGVDVADLSHRSACDPDLLNDQLDLRLYDDGVPATGRQMVHALAAVYRAVTGPNDIGTREEMLRLFQKLQLLRPAFALPTDRSDRSGLLRFCSEQTVQWLQPYFASAPTFFHPEGLAAVCA